MKLRNVKHNHGTTRNAKERNAKKLRLLIRKVKALYEMITGCNKKNVPLTDVIFDCFANNFCYF